MKLTRIALGLAVAGVSIGLMSCDWDFGGQADQTTDRYGWVNFTGLYRGEAGRLLVTEYSTMPGDGGNVIGNERIGTGDGARVTWVGRLANRMITPGTLTIRADLVTGPVSVAEGDTITGGNGDENGDPDNGNGDPGNGYGQGGTLTIEYTTGAFSVTFGAPPTAGSSISATYEYTQPDTGGTGIRIVTFNVIQEGNRLQFIDNNGSVYEGNFGSVRSTGNEGRDTPLQGRIPTGGQVIAQFSVRGNSAAGYLVTITGTFQASVQAVGDPQPGEEQRIRLTNREVFGTWLERGGRNGDVHGVAEDVVVAGGGGTPAPTP